MNGFGSGFKPHPYFEGILICVNCFYRFFETVFRV